MDHASRPFGKYFHGAHMVWGAINEITAMNAYRRLSDLAGHPVLEQLLIGIVQEESIHSSFYWNVARVKLRETAVFEKPCEVHHREFWKPVGQGAKPEAKRITLWRRCGRAKKVWICLIRRSRVVSSACRVSLGSRD